jgi:Fur family ferric uptake transcriptional regulator
MAKRKKESELEAQIKQQGIRLTQPRRVVLQALTNSTGHVNAKELYAKIHKKNPEIGLTTIYRTLDLLEKMNLLNKFAFGDGQTRYELSWQYIEHHHHLVCLHCQHIIDYNDFISEEVKFFAEIEKVLSKKYNFDITSHEVRFLGICEKCRQNR